MTKVNKIFNISMSILITIGLVLLSIFVFPSALKTFIMSFANFACDLGMYFIDTFNLPFKITKPIINIPYLPSQKPPTIVLPSDIATFKIRITMFWSLLFNKYSFMEYSYTYFNFLMVGINVVLMIIPIYIMAKLLLKKHYFEKHNNDYDKNSLPLRQYINLSAKTMLPIKNLLLSFCEFVRLRKYIYLSWLILIMYNLNVISTALVALGRYFNFSHTLDFKSLFFVLIDVIKCIYPIISKIPLIIWIVISLIVVIHYRKMLGYANLRRFEEKNQKIVKNLPICVLNVGTMGSRKTTILTDMTLSCAVIHRKEALKIVLEIEFEFPNFPWAKFCECINKCKESDDVYNLVSARIIIADWQATFLDNPCKENIFGYDFERYGLFYDNKLEEKFIFQELTDYAQAYFIYTISTSLIISNFGIREDFLLSDLKNLPIWDFDFFNRDSKKIHQMSTYSHILNFDSLRMGMKMCKDPTAVGLFEFGIIDVTELAKERGNMLDHKELEKKAEEVNQKNDMFDRELKLIRHSATVRNFPFVMFFADDQRAMSLGADIRELHSIINIVGKPGFKRCLPFFLIEEALNIFIFSKFADTYVKYRYIRGDNTLFMHLLKNISTKFINYYKRTYNLFSVAECRLEMENGTMDGGKQADAYYLMPKKIYSGRFATDCFKEFIEPKIQAKKTGLMNMPTYKNIYPTKEDFDNMRSFFIRELNKIAKSNTIDGKLTNAIISKKIEKAEKDTS